MEHSKLIQQAIQFAAKAHEGQTRKLHDEPFMNHPWNVANTLRNAGFGDELIAAAFLHDVVEDTDVAASSILALFGEEVSRYVEANTEDMGLSWRERKLMTIQRASSASLEVKALIAADKLDNLSSIMKYLKLDGDKVWSAFSAGPEAQCWYYNRIAEAIFANIERITVPAFFFDYEVLVTELNDMVCNKKDGAI